jgi:hypothetical protein
VSSTRFVLGRIDGARRERTGSSGARGASPDQNLRATVPLLGNDGCISEKVESITRLRPRIGWDRAHPPRSHPIQDRTDDEILTYADVAFDQILDELTM